ncbi:MAG: phospholipase D-like domain-containing protein [Micropruina sp.]|nr:hypothetical protein [Micropruina sp.]
MPTPGVSVGATSSATASTSPSVSVSPSSSTITPTPTPTPTITIPPYKATPVAGSKFNNPYSSDEKVRYTVINYMTGLINSAAAGSTVRIAMYSLNVDATKEAIIAAKLRGVRVQFVTDDHGIGTSQMKEVIAALGTTVTPTGSYISICDFSCSSDFLSFDLLTGEEIRPYLHAKYLTFSAVGASKNVSLITSSNFTKTQASEGFNNIYTIVGDTVLYNFLQDRFNLMLLDRDDLPAYASMTSGTKKLYFFPANVGDPLDVATDPYYGILSNIRCTGVASGYGTYPSSPTKSRTQVRVSMFQWSKARNYLARKLKELNNAGCDVKVIMSKLDWDPEVASILLAPGGKYGNIEIKNADIDTDKDANLEYFVHNKYILVNGKYLSDSSSKLVFTGSANFTRSALRYSNELGVKVDSAATHKSYKANFDLIYNNYSVPQGIWTR